MALHINKNRDNIIDSIQNIDDVLPNTTVDDFFDMAFKVYNSTLGSQLVEVKATDVKSIVMKVDYSTSM